MCAAVRVRYAPSPTGEPHLGNIRTALFNWLFARKWGGAFILRIEDTDQARQVEGASEAIVDALQWLGMDWDEGPDVGGAYGPYVQSERLDVYRQHAEWLVAEGCAYYCYCSSARLESVRREQQRRREPPRYDRRCRDLLPEQRAALARENPHAVVRFRTPTDGNVVVRDELRGDISFDTALLDDFILLKSDGFPTYHLANVVDDHLMAISHVMRAEEWLPSAPRHKLLYEALGYAMPVVAHLPMILGPDRGKLSKRHGSTSVLEYRAQGYLPDALVNFMVLLGWSLDDRTDVISREMLLKHFDLNRVAVSPAVFSVEKLDWFNGVYLRALDPEAFADLLVPWLEAGLPEEVVRPIDRGYVRRIVPLEQERIRRLSEAPELLSFFFVRQPRFNPLKMIQKGMVRDDTREVLHRSLDILQHLARWEARALESALRPLTEILALKAGQVFGVLRLAITGREATPPLFDTMEVMGKDRCLWRLEAAVAFANAIPSAC